MKKDDKIKHLPKNKVQTIDTKIEEIEKLNVEGQEEYFENILKKIYSGEEIDSIKKYALKCIKLMCDPKDSKIHLPYGVIAIKKNNRIALKIDNKKHWFIFLVFFTLLFLSILGASYSYINYSIIKELNKDIDGDGIADINLDLNNDRIPEINVDTNRDNKPNYNIDYKGNRKPVFNIDTNHNGIADYNLINNDTDKDGKCDINCDINKDGWPDINLDLNGDGILDMEIDTDGDGKPDLNFDMNGDMVCDLHCDTTGNGKCDTFCLTSDELDNISLIKSGTSTNIVNKDISLSAGELVLEYEDENTVYITGIFPDDQPFYNQDIKPKKFKVTNKSDLYVMYNLRWVVTLNDYVTDNFKYSLSSTLNGASFDFITVPKESGPIATDIMIPPFSTQDYEINFKLQGIGSKQNEDQGKTFAGHIEIYLDNE